MKFREMIGVRVDVTLHISAMRIVLEIALGYREKQAHLFRGT
jgi:hypothetical protein